MTAPHGLKNFVLGEGGYTLLELLVVLAITGAVISGITAAFVSGSKAELDMNRRFVAQQNVRLALTQLRTDIHASCSASASTTGLLLYPATSPTACAATPSIVWCTGTSAQITGRYTLTSNSAASCANPPTGKLWADYLTTNSLFVVNTPSSGQRMSVSVDLPVNTSRLSSAPSTVDNYELKDTIVLRNAIPAP